MTDSKYYRTLLIPILALAVAAVWTPDVMAQRGKGGGGARPSMGKVGGGGSRPSMSRPSGGGRPSMGNANMSRPSPSRPSMGNAISRPSTARPSPSFGAGGARPSLGGAGGRPNMTRPSNPIAGNRPAGNRPALPTAPNRPSVRPPSSLPSLNRPSTGIGQVRPSLPNAGNRPSLPTGNRPTTLPGIANRPGGADRPTFGNVNRPTTLPGILDRPGSNNRPGIGNANRPTTLPGNLNRPGENNRPNFPNNVNRPAIGGNRPVIGGNRPVFGNDTNINIGNKLNVGNQIGNNQIRNNRYSNRPNWDVDPGFSRPGWGINGGDWHHRWHDHCINGRHDWYIGCWHGYWGSNWYAPVVWGTVGWGLGYGSSYYNPYYAEPVVAQAMPYDYSQPVVINNYVSSDAEGGEVSQPESTPEQQQALSSFDDGLAKFKAGDYIAALSAFNSALKQLPGDAVVHEVRSLALFAVGDYKAAAAGLNSLLSAAPGMDWTTMSGLYGNPEDYTAQFRKLEEFASTNPNDASAHFVLAYHYMVTGSKDDAIGALKVVVNNQPKDVTAKRMLEAMVPPETTAVASIPITPALPANGEAPETDLVGSWVAQQGETKISLAIGEDSQFIWKTTSPGQSPVELTGQLSAGAEGIELETADQGTMAGSVTSQGPDNWQFAISGAPASDPGLSFARAK